MTDERRTAGWLLLAVVLVAVVVWTSPRTRQSADDPRLGEVLFPEFVEGKQIGSLEVIAFDANAAIVRPIKVQRMGERWIIESHHNYPADGGGLGTTSAALIGLQATELASDEVVDHERLHVLDPLDQTLPTSQGRGVRITVHDLSGRLLTDVIIGGTVDNRPEYRYVRLPGQRRTYVARMTDFRVSTELADWIEPRLLPLRREEIDGIVISALSADGTQPVVPRSLPVILRRGSGREWLLAGSAAPERPAPAAVNLLITRLLALSIADVRPKPPDLAALMAAGGGVRLTTAAAADLAAQGFYLSRDGRLIASYGEAIIHTESGLFFAVRFGGVVNGGGRFVMVTPGRDRSPSPTRPDASPSASADELRARFAPWYFVVKGDAVAGVRMTRDDVLRRQMP